MVNDIHPDVTFAQRRTCNRERALREQWVKIANIGSLPRQTVATHAALAPLAALGQDAGQCSEKCITDVVPVLSPVVSFMFTGFVVGRRNSASSIDGIDKTVSPKWVNGSSERYSMNGSLEDAVPKLVQLG
jgi:hypothetical protein